MTNTTAALRSKVKDVTGALRSRRYRRRQNTNESKAGVTLRTASLPAFVLRLPKGMPAGVRSCTKCERNMRTDNVTVNLPEGEKVYGGLPGETPDQTIKRVTTLHPDWTSMVLVILREG